MFRRSRFSIRPNVGTAGRTAATPQEAPSDGQEASEPPTDVSESSTAAAVAADNKSVVTPSEKPTAPGDDQNGEGTSSSAAVQRRKRFSIKPKVASGRPPTLARTPKSPVKAVSETPVRVPSSDKPTTSSQTGSPAAPQGLRSPRRRRPSEESKQPKVQPKPTLLSSDTSAPSAGPAAEDSVEQNRLPEDSGKQLESTSGSQVKEVPSRPPVPPSLPDKEAIEISEKAKTIMSSKIGLSLSPPAFSLSRLLNDPSDLQRLAKAKKLRELLKQEMHKERKIKKAKTRTTEYTLDPGKMTMRDLIRYLPLSNPMTSSLENSEAQENETVVPPSPGREESPERAQEPEVLPKIASPTEEEEEADEDQEEAFLVPQVKVAEDGSLIIDEESLTVEVQRAKGPNPVQDRDPIFERGSTTTYSSFRKGTYSKPWSSEETDMFFLAISMVGTDFSMICQLFPHRARSEIKNKFKKEERVNSWRIDKAFRERRKLDIEYFSKLLEKILEVQKNRKKLKSLADKNSPKKHKRKAKGKKAAKKLKDVEEEDEEEEEEEENEIPVLEGEGGEKENEDLCNEGGTPVSKPKKKRKRKNVQEASTEEPKDKKNKAGEKRNEQDEADTPEDAEAALPEDCTSSEISEKTENVNAAKEAAIKPARLSRGRAPKPLLPLGRKWGKKPPPPSSKGKDTASDKGDGSASDGVSTEKVKKDASPLRQANRRKSDNDDISAEEEDVTVEPPRPTRYGRVPKPTKPLTYAAREDAHSSVSETTPASPAGSAAKPAPKCTAKRGRSSKQQSSQESKKPKLVTLRASRSEYSDEENEQQWEEEEVEEAQHPTCSPSKEGSASAFVPASLRSPHPVICEVEETMEELDILANMPDVLGISQDALCPDAFCEQAQNETGTAENNSEHQLDLLVDVIDFLSSEHTEVCEDESYNEAAHTLLTIGNLAHLSQSAQNQIAMQEDRTGTTSSDVNEASQQIEEEIISKPAAQEENSAILTSATPGHEFTETSEAGAVVELQNSTTGNVAMPLSKTSDQRTGSDTDPAAQVHSSPESSEKNSPQARRRRLSRVNPKPNLGQASKAAQSKSQPETPTGRTAIESHTVAPGLSPSTESLSAVKETPERVDGCQDISCNEVKLTEEPSGLQECSDGQVKSGAATSDQSVSENQTQSFSDAQFEPSLGQTTTGLMSTPEPTGEKLISHVGATESSCSSPPTSDSAVAEPQVEQRSNMDSVQESSDHPAPCVSGEEELPVSQKEESASNPQTRKSRFQKGKPKPNLAQTSRTVRSKAQPRKDAVEKDCNPTPNPKCKEKTITEVEAEPTCTTFHEKPSQSTGPASDFIPPLDLGSTLTSTEELSAAEEKKTGVAIVGGQVESGAAASPQSASENQNFSGAKCEPSGEQATGDTRSTPEPTGETLISRLGTTESSCSSPLTSDSAVEEPQVEKESNMDSVQESSDHPAPCVSGEEELPVSQKEEGEVASTCQSRKSRFQKIQPATHMQLAEKPLSPTSRPESTLSTIADEEAQPTCSTAPIKSTDTASLSVPSLKLCSTVEPAGELPSTGEQITDVGLDSSSEGSQPNVPQSRRRFPKVKPKPNLRSSSRITQTKVESKDSKTQSQDEVQQCSETTETNQTAAQSTHDDQPEPTRSSITSNKAPQSRRGRLVKPKPNLRRSSQPPDLQQVHSTKQAEAGEEAAVSHKPASELQTDSQEPAGGAPEQAGNPNFPPPDVSAQDASTLSTGHPSVTIFPDMLSEQVPSDPDEPFFILSLTEIPVCSSGEVLASEPLSYVPATDASERQQSLGLLANVAAPVSVEESGDTDVVSVKAVGPDPAASVDSIMENPVAPHETVQPSKLIETGESNGETETPPTRPRLTASGRRAKLQVKPNTPGKKQDSKTFAVGGAETSPIQRNPAQHSEPPGSSVQPKASDEVFTEPQKGSGEQTAQTSTRNRKPKGFLSFLSETNSATPSNEPPPGKAASKGPKAKTPRAARKRPTPAAVASQTQPPEETHSTSSSKSPPQAEVDVEQAPEAVDSGRSSDPPPSTSLCAAEVSSSQSSGCVESSAAEEEPTSVCQYFLSDIFTEVEDE